MPTTNSMKLIRHKQRRKGVLVPLLEDLFQRPVEPETEDEIEFIADILRSQIRRQDDRNYRPVFSPSQLSECLRYVYLLKHHKELEISRAAIVRVEPHYYFFTGNFLHLKWQFALYKLDKSLPDEIFKLIGVEVPILSKRKDHGGTVDALVLIHGEPYIVDFKGLNVRSFGEITRGSIPPQYALQLSDYGMLFNSQKQNNGRVTNALLITENKGGPTPKHLIALHETAVEISVHLPEVRGRLEVLRENEEANTIPRPECVSTQTIQFLGCPFRKFCREEVKEIQKQRREIEDRNAAGLKVARPERSRTRRSRGNSNGRGSRPA